MDPKSRTNAPTPLPVRRALRDISDSVSRWRRLRGLTQAQLAERAGVSRGVARRLEAGDGGVSLENLLRILRALGVSELVSDALDPLSSDIGRLRAEQALPERVRPKRLTHESSPRPAR
jgi:transcriptional regulator with XRE-family HTH domain